MKALIALLAFLGPIALVLIVGFTYRWLSRKPDPRVSEDPTNYQALYDEHTFRIGRRPH